LDRLSVSLAKPTSNQPSSLSHRVTVRQTPLTAIESPSLQSPRTSPALAITKLNPSNSVVGEMDLMVPSVCRRGTVSSERAKWTERELAHLD